MTEDRPLPDAEPETWLEKIAAIVPTLGKDDDIRDLEMVEGVRVTLADEVDLNERVWSR